MNEDIVENNINNSIEENIRVQILRYVMINGSFIITDIVKVTGYSVTTIIKYVNSLIESNFIKVIGKEKNNYKGRQAIIYGINDDSSFFIGVDIKNNILSIAMMNLLGQIIYKETHTEFSFNNNHQSLDYVCNKTLEFINKQNNIDRSKIISICFNLSGRVNSKLGTSASVYNFEEMQDTPLADILSERLGVKAYIENDTKSMAYGEYASWLNKKFKDVIYINVGWGLGAAFIINGKLYSGMDGYSGELGHVNMYNNNILCHCGKKGCLETEISGRAISRKIAERINNGEMSILSKKVKEGKILTIRDIIEAADKEDPLTIEIIEQTSSELGHQIAGLLNLFNPEAIVFGGELSEADSIYFARPIELSIKKYSLKLINQKVKILTSELKDDAGVIGACYIARSRSYNDLF